MKWSRLKQLVLPLVAASVAGQQIDYNSDVQFGPGILSDSSRKPYSTFYAACSDAGSKGLTLAITRAWSISTTGTCEARLVASGGTVQLARGQTITIKAPFSAPPMLKIFDVSAGGKVVFTQGVIDNVYPQWWGAKGDDRNDDTAAIQAAVDACGGSAACAVVLPPGTYNTTAEIKLYGARPYGGLKFCGSGPFSTTIDYHGPPTSSAVHAIGYAQKICDLRITDSNSTGWIDGISYDGIREIGLSTGGQIDHVFIECNAHPGNGISAGRGRYQADQLIVNKPYIVNCTQGFGFGTLDPNAVDIALYDASLVNNWIGAAASTSTNLSIFGGSIDDNSVNFACGTGGPCLVSGIRSERSARSFFSSVGKYPSPVTFENYIVSMNETTRVATTTTASVGACTVPLNYKDDGRAQTKFTFGDFIVIVGAGAAGADLHTQITSMSSPFSAGLSGTLPCVGTSVRDAAVRFDSTVQQNDFEEHAGGPYVHNNVVVNTLSGGAVSYDGNGPQIFNGMAWREKYSNPFNLPPGTRCPIVPNIGSLVSWRGLTSDINVATRALPDYSFTSNANTIQYAIAGPGSAENAIVAESTLWCSPPLQPGLTVQVQLGAHGLQAGLNTLNYAGNGPYPIKSHRKYNADISTGYTAHAVIEVQWNEGKFFVDLSQ